MTRLIPELKTYEQWPAQIAGRIPVE